MQGYVFSLVDNAHTATAQKADDFDSLGYDGSRGKTLRLRNLNHWFTQEAAHLLMIQQELLDLFAQLVLPRRPRRETNPSLQEAAAGPRQTQPSPAANCQA